jgi:hypothetical protein
MSAYLLTGLAILIVMVFGIFGLALCKAASKPTPPPNDHDSVH